MIVLLHTDVVKPQAEALEQHLKAAFNDHLQIELKSATAPTVWGANASWDDLLVIFFDNSPFPKSGSDFIETYKANRGGENAQILPVAVTRGYTHPPKFADHIKALELNSAAVGPAGKLARRVGAMLGLRVQPRDSQIFLSYRANDGTQIAEQLEHHLKSLSYPVWRDEATELDGSTRILPGTLVQKQIDEGLGRASMVLLIDTPNAPHSHWIEHEVETANGLLVPILPLCFRSAADHKKGPRFYALAQLQRWVELPLNDPSLVPSISSTDLDKIVAEMENYLCEIFQRKCRVPSLVEKEFRLRNFSWNILDRRLLIGESVKAQNPRITTKVLSHCSMFDQVHSPALSVFSDFLKKTGRPNHSLYIYDGDLIPEPQLLKIIQDSPKEVPVIILHHQELATLIDSNFTTL